MSSRWVFSQEDVDADNRRRFAALIAEHEAVKAERSAWRRRALRAESLLQVHGIAYAPPACRVDESGGVA